MHKTKSSEIDGIGNSFFFFLLRIIFLAIISCMLLFLFIYNFIVLQGWRNPYENQPGRKPTIPASMIHRRGYNSRKKNGTHLQKSTLIEAWRNWYHHLSSANGLSRMLIGSQWHHGKKTAVRRRNNSSVFSVGFKQVSSFTLGCSPVGVGCRLELFDWEYVKPLACRLFFFFIFFFFLFINLWPVCIIEGWLVSSRGFSEICALFNWHMFARYVCIDYFEIHDDASRGIHWVVANLVTYMFGVLYCLRGP